MVDSNDQILNYYHPQALAHLRKESLDLYNRLHSIAEDITFVSGIHDVYSELPIIPNLRCGAWYVDPSIAIEEPAYFKSTDGHFNNWSFNLRRPNIHLLNVIANQRGLVLVDSTRAGKRIPDALSKTVPIWCAVVNRAIKLVHSKTDDWDTCLYTPPAVVSAQEHSQMEARLDEWAAQLHASSYVIPDLARPLRPLWITPRNTSYPRIPGPSEREFYPFICVSASKQISEGIERRSSGFSYVQGSGDDHELWGQGLTPSIFWNHREEILKADRSEIQAVVEALAQKVVSPPSLGSSKATASPISKVGGKLLIGVVSDLPQHLPTDIKGSECTMSYVIVSEHLPARDETMGDETQSQWPGKDVLALSLPGGKKGQAQFLSTILPKAIPYIDSALAQGHTMCICCDTGKDASVGLALATLQLFFNDEGRYIATSDRDRSRTVDKKSLSARLQWIISSRPQANPSRTTLKRVNEFLMTPSNFIRRSS